VTNARSGRSFSSRPFGTIEPSLNAGDWEGALRNGLIRNSRLYRRVLPLTDSKGELGQALRHALQEGHVPDLTYGDW
jgi:hypothetical protein